MLLPIEQYILLGRVQIRMRSQKQNIFLSIASLISLFVLVSYAFTSTPTRVEKVGNFYKHTYPNFQLLSHQRQPQYNSHPSSNNREILSNMIKALSKIQKSLQIMNMDGEGFYELVLLTQPHNYYNKVIIIKQKYQQFVIANKNIYLNGLEKEIKIYSFHIYNEDGVEKYYGPGELVKLIFSPEAEQNQELINSNLRICVSLLKIIEIAKEKSLGENNPQNFETLQIFATINSGRQIFILKNEIKKIKNVVNMQLVIEITRPILLQINSFNDNFSSRDKLTQNTDSQPQRFKFYKINLKTKNQKQSLQFKQLNEQILSLQSPQYNSESLLQKGIYYITNSNNLFKTSL